MANSEAARTFVLIHVGGGAVLLTARCRESEKEKGLALGADDYIIKPFSTRELATKLKQILD